MVNPEQLEFIKQKIKNLKDATGCYLWKDKDQNVIYVGKAIRLEDRIKSYLASNVSDQKTHQLQQEIYDLDWILTNTEHEALILEANLIKKYSPKYNVRLKDDKKYPFICISVDEPYPMVYLTRKVKGDNKKYYGPYTDVKAAREFLQLLHRIFPIRKTPLKLPLKTPQRPCLNYHIQRCLAPCAGNISEEDYNSMIQMVIYFMEGKREKIISELEKKMYEYSEKMLFERAAIYRNMIRSLQEMNSKQSIINTTLGDEDILALAQREDTGQMVVFEVRGGKLEGKKSFALSGLKNSDLLETYISFIKLYYLQSSFIPSGIRIPFKSNSEILTLQDTLSKVAEKTVRLKAVSGGTVLSLWKLAQKNAEMNLTERILATKLKEEKQALKNLQEILQLPDIPKIIECYDISHFQGSQAVGSGVMFVDGKLHKPGYRHYNIRGYTQVNDPGMIHEIISRRLTRIQNENLKIPDLIVIDGGETQLARACEAAKNLGFEHIPIIGLAKKREEIYLPNEKYPYKFDINLPAIRLLRRIRDEAHRFGIEFHRKRRNRTTLEGILDKIPNIGVKRRTKILKQILNKKRLREVSKEDLLQVDGIGEELAEQILKHIRQREALREI